jgi:hypothetical protein
VIHDGFALGSAVLPAISEGWPAVLVSLKTLLETVILAHLVTAPAETARVPRPELQPRQIPTSNMTMRR